MLLVFPPRKCIEMVAVVEYCNNFKPSKAFSKRIWGLGCFCGWFYILFCGDFFFFLGGGWGLWCVCVGGGGCVVVVLLFIINMVLIMLLLICY